MSTYKQQALIEAPVEDVWGLIADPKRYPEWAGDAIETTGVPSKIELGSTFEQKSTGPLGSKPTTVFKVEELEDLHRIKLRCQRTGYYSRWTLTEARGQTFADVEFGFEPTGLAGRAVEAITTKRSLRDLATDSLDSMRQLLQRPGRR